MSDKDIRFLADSLIRMNTMHWDITHLQPGDHLCYFYDTDKEHAAVFTPFFKHALGRNEQVIYLCDTHPGDVIERYITVAGYDMDILRRNGQLVLTNRIALGLADRESLTRWLAAQLAHINGRCWIACELDWTLNDINSPVQMGDYEHWLEATFHAITHTSLAQYNRLLSPPGLLLELLNAHPQVLVGQTLHIHPRADLTQLYPVTLQQWLDTLAERKRTQEALQESLYFLQVLIDAIPLPIFYKDMQGRYRGCNTAFETMMGVKRGEIVGKCVYDLSPQELADIYFARDAELYTQLGVQVYESQVYYADGTFHDVIFNKATFTTLDGSPAGMVGVVIDISERRRVEEALRQSEMRYRLVSELTSDFAYAMHITAQGHWDFDWVTDAFKQVTGYAPDEITEIKHWHTIVHPDDLEAYVAMVETLLRGEVLETDLRITAKNGELRWLRARGRPVWDKDQTQVTHIYGTVRDITERKQMEQYLLRTERLAAMGRLAAALAHEINNPLQALQNNLELALDFPITEEERRQHLETVRGEIERLMSLSRRVLDLARPPQLEMTHAGPIALLDIIRHALTLYHKEMQQQQIAVQLDFPDDLPQVRGARDWLTQICLNLILNAIEAMPNGGTLTITASASRKQKWVELAFCDTGSGILPEALEMIFEPFYTTKPQGTGMGLPICHNLTQQLGGTMRVRNEPDCGACFYVTLPAIRPAKKRAPHANV